MMNNICPNSWWHIACNLASYTSLVLVLRVPFEPRILTDRLQMELLYAQHPLEVVAVVV